MSGSTRLVPAQPAATGAGGARGRNGMRAALRRLVAAAALVAGSALSAYGKHEPVAAPRDISGSYALNTMADAPVPAVLLDTTLIGPGGRSTRLAVLVEGATVTLARSGGYTVELRYRLRVDERTEPVQALTFGGSYVVGGSTVTFTSATGEVATGSVSDGVLTVTKELLEMDAFRRWCVTASGTTAAI